MMPLLQIKQVLYCIRDVILVYILNYMTINHLGNVSNIPVRYTIIIIISLSLIYCSFRCLSSLIKISFQLITINNHFQRYKKKSENKKLSVTIILSFFVYLYLISLNINALEEFNKIDFYLLIFKAITF